MDRGDQGKNGRRWKHAAWSWTKEESSSLAVSTEAVLLTLIVDAREGRDVAVVDIPNAFIQTKVDDAKDRVIFGSQE